MTTDIIIARAKVQSVSTSVRDGKNYSLVFFRINGECVPVDMIANGLSTKQVLTAGERVKVKYKCLDHKIKLVAYLKSNGQEYSKERN